MYIFVLLSICISLINLACTTSNHERLVQKQGLVGAYYGNADFTNIKESELLHRLEMSWDEETGHGRSWSGIWEGLIDAPVSGKVTFYLSTTQSAALEIARQPRISVENDPDSLQVELEMDKGHAYPIKIWYGHVKGGEGYLNIQWSWGSLPRSKIPPERIYFTSRQAEKWNWVIEPDPQDIDYSQFIKAEAKHVMVYDEPGRFCGWPANNGIWLWEDEVLVGFTLSYYQEKELHHSVDETKPSKSVLARSLNGGTTWSLEDPENFVGDGGKVKKLRQPIDFNHPDFAFRSNGSNYFYSYDRGKSWNGPFEFPPLVDSKLTSRTDYLILNDKTCLFFLSAEEDQVWARLQDRAFAAVTKDGGSTFQFLSWITDSIKVRSVMPSTVRINDSHLVSALRRRFDRKYENKPRYPQNWIDVYESLDQGRTWQFLSKVADTDRGKHNGNPPCLLKLEDGRLCVTYGFRGVPYGIRAKLSSDNGKTWGEEIHLRDDGRTFDLGYTRSVQRTDGKIITIYYYTTDKYREQHIAATIWDPKSIRESG